MSDAMKGHDLHSKRQHPTTKTRDKDSVSTSSGPEETQCERYTRVFCTRFIWGFKRFLTFLFSIVGVSCLTVGYAILGGIIFKEIELPKEKETRAHVVMTKDVYVNKIVEFYDESDIETVLDKNTWNAKVNALLRVSYKSCLIDLLRNVLYNLT